MLVVLIVMILTFSTETLIQTNVPSYKQSDVLNSQTVLIQIFRKTWNTVFSRLNAGGVYLKLDLADPAFIRTRRLFGARRLFIKCIFQYLRFIEPRAKFQQKRLKDVGKCHQLCPI